MPVAVQPGEVVIGLPQKGRCLENDEANERKLNGDVAFECQTPKKANGWVSPKLRMGSIPGLNLPGRAIR